jgi:predicted transcriptional regulator
VIVEEGEYLAHYGVLRRSGRYPWGSGGHNETARSKHFLDYVADLKRQGLTESQIAQGFAMGPTETLSINELRASVSIASNQQKAAKIALFTRLKDKGYSTTAIAKRTGEAESVVRSYLAPGAAERVSKLTNTANQLRDRVDEVGLVDIGRGNENYLGVSSTRLDTAVAMLKQEGYEVHHVPGPQVTGAHTTNMKVLAPPGTTRSYVYNNMDKIQQVKSFSDDGGETFGHIREPIAINPKRVEVIYKEHGGSEKDGMIYVRPGVEDVSIGGSKYAQVRVAVGKDHYLKGMAMYKDDLPPGVDVQFHTAKSDKGDKLSAMKKNSDEETYSEGGPHVLLKSVKRQILADPGTPKERVTSAMNIVNEEGIWTTWSKDMSSQMLSKQKPILAKSQLNMTYERSQQEFDNINRLTNATVKKKLLDDFASAVDSDAVDLQASALPRTSQHVILPLSKIKATEIYAPQYKHGEKVVLIRHPHGGVFEIPELVVNNNNPEGKRLLGQSRDAVGIHHEVAKHLSGADFDGDTVLVIPNNAQRVKHSKALDGLKDFDPREAYPGYPGMKPMTKLGKQKEMGSVSNLITDMSLRDASHAELAQAIRHSMVVIDAEKHNLNHKQSYIDNGIKNLKKKYQSGGASTIVSRATSPTYLPERKPRTRGKGGPIDLETGELKFEPTNRRRASGKPVIVRFDKLAVTSDARELMSTPIGTPMERIYAGHSNKLKALANKARLTSERTPNPKMSSSARKVYAPQVKSLKDKLDLVERNAPLERQAQLIASANMKMRKEANPNMDEATEKKLSYQSLVQARIRTGASKLDIEFTDHEWEAVQHGAISHSMLNDILQHANMKNVREHATPKTPLKMTPIKTIRARQMIADGYTLEQVAKDLGVSVTTLETAVKG